MYYKLKKIYPILIIIALSLLILIPFFKINQLGVHSDWSFHAARVQQLYLNLTRGHFFTYSATDTFSKVGNGNFLFYPTFFLYPWAFLKLFFTPIASYLIYVWLLFVATGLIAFFCMQSFDKQATWQSLFFALIYMIAPYHLYLTLNNYVLGEAQAYMFIPLVLLGMYNVIYKDKWVMLAIGMTMMAYTHYVSLFISVEVCVAILVCYLIQNKKIELSKFVILAKSIGLFILLSLWQFIPLFTDYFHRDLFRPNPGFMLMQSAGDFFVSAVSNGALCQVSNGTLRQGGIGLILLFTLIFGWLLIDKNSKYMWVYLLGVLFTWMITTAFPWHYFIKTPLAIIQFPYRYTGYATAFLAITLSKILFTLQFDKVNKNVINWGIVLIMPVLYAGSISPIIARNSNSDGTVPVLTSQRTGNYKTFRDAKDLPIIINNSSYNKQFSYGALYGETDYMPMKAIENVESVLNRVSYINGHKKLLRQYSKANEIHYLVNTNRRSIINLPALQYHNTRVYINNRLVDTQISDRGTVLTNLPKGKYNIEVTYKPSMLLIVARVIAVMSWIYIVFLWGIKLWKIARNNLNEFSDVD
ncbi:hypothetical protein BGL41_00095 [Fructilactobacillus sanfranciscensis]|uniref:hypothetical protein n=1 Tax=Fructilactobacillus sanfranciscensis TaxID=1625 RepID=UPI000CD3BC82|nr:hypothetical protein [Fructilactobacillus sanfranciscensis]POH15511.1 hypothetical protein BGL41_00095 [Fructilactobacillus sanfranciscensis]